MAKDTFWFRHDLNARNDKKLVKVKLKHRQKGIGIYWSLVEMLFEESGKLNIADLEFIAGDLKEKEATVRSIVFDFDLFKNDEKTFWSNSVNIRLSERKDKSDKAAESAKKRWVNANAMQSHSEGNAIEERRVKKKREDKRIREDISNPFSAKFLPTWGKWKKYKLDEHRETFKALDTENLALKKLFELAQGNETAAAEIIDQSISNQWKGLFELKTNNNAHQPTHRKNGTTKDSGAEQLIDDLRKETGSTYT